MFVYKLQNNMRFQVRHLDKVGCSSHAYRDVAQWQSVRFAREMPRFDPRHLQKILITLFNILRWMYTVFWFVFVLNITATSSGTTRTSLRNAVVRLSFLTFTNPFGSVSSQISKPFKNDLHQMILLRVLCKAQLCPQLKGHERTS